ncbi:MAG: BldC family transcriptional regulator [Actinomycetales bacterium]
MNRRGPENERLLTPGEVAEMFRVSPKTVARWASAGKITAVRTLGGHRRYRESEALALLAHSTFEASDDMPQREI